MTRMINDHTYSWCTGEQSCPGVGYTDEKTGQETCVSVAYCTSMSYWYAYAYGKERKCRESVPLYKDEFEVKSGVYSCRPDMYISF